jgi:hypothetical protein
LAQTSAAIGAEIDFIAAHCRGTGTPESVEEHIRADRIFWTSLTKGARTSAEMTTLRCMEHLPSMLVLAIFIASK